MNDGPAATRMRARVRLRRGRLNLDVELDGHTVALVGPNGSGKTTVLRALAGAVPNAEVELEVGGTTIVSARRAINPPMESRALGYVPQAHGLFPHLSAVDNVAFGLVHGSKRERRERARALLATLGAADLEGRRAAVLSGGERQRVALARALLIEPKLLLLDEPLVALDPASRRALRATLRAHLGPRPSVIVTHDVRDLMAFGARIHALEDGRIVAQGPLEELARVPATPFLKELLGPLSA